LKAWNTGSIPGVKKVTQIDRDFAIAAAYEAFTATDDYIEEWSLK
jgi:hypothetical protein